MTNKTDTEKFLYKRAISKDADFNIWSVFPANKTFGMSALGYLSIFKMFDMHEDYSVERVFLDSQTTKIPYNKVDVIFLSFVFEFDFLQIFKIFDKFSIPYKSKDRGENAPIVIIGGPVMTANPEPFAEFFDCIVVGDAEDIDKDVIDVIKNNRGLPKTEILRKIVGVQGIYIPEFSEYNKESREVLYNGDKFTVKRRSANLKECVATPILTENSYFKNTYVIEIARGCPMRCGFCLASYMTLPTRHPSFESVVNNIDFGLQNTDKIALLGALISSHPDYDKICEYIYQKACNGEKFELSVSSLRADFISDISVKMLVACGQKHSTIAIEAGSERLRKVINKNLTNEQIKNAVDVCYKNGLKGLKIYAMIGLPTETMQDLEELIELIKSLKSEFKGFDLSLSFASFVPKAQTPFQFCKREDNKSLEKKYEFLRKQFAKIGVKISVSSVKWDYYQALLARGDRQLTDYLIEVYKAGANLGAFKTVYKEYEKNGVLPSSDYFALREIERHEILPWEYITSCVDKEFLAKENARLLQN